MFETFLSKLSELFALTGLGEFRIVLSSSSTPQQFHYSCVTVVEARDVPGPPALVLFFLHTQTFSDVGCVCYAVGWWPTENTAPGWSKLICRRRRTDISSASGILPLTLCATSFIPPLARLYWLWLPPIPPRPSSVNGDVRFFEPRAPDSINVLQTVKGLTALDIHPQANLFAWWDPTLTSFHTVSPTLLHFSK